MDVSENLELPGTGTLSGWKMEVMTPESKQVKGATKE